MSCHRLHRPYCTPCNFLRILTCSEIYKYGRISCHQQCASWRYGESSIHYTKLSSRPKVAAATAVERLSVMSRRDCGKGGSVASSETALLFPLSHNRGGGTSVRLAFRPAT